MDAMAMPDRQTTAAAVTFTFVLQGGRVGGRMEPEKTVPSSGADRGEKRRKERGGERWSEQCRHKLI